jgi:hypothetical protein
MIMFFRPNVSTYISLGLVLTGIGMDLGMGGDLIFVKSVTAMWRMQEFVGWNAVSNIPRCGEICNQ